MTDQPCRIAIVAADFNQAVVHPMIEAAREEIAAAGAELSREITVPGSYEVPIIAQRLLERDDVDILVAIGFIERGETLHGEVMGHVVHEALVDLSLANRKPVGIGIIGPGCTPEQAEVRKIEYARAAVKASLRAWQQLAAID